MYKGMDKAVVEELLDLSTRTTSLLLKLISPGSIKNLLLQSDNEEIINEAADILEICNRTNKIFLLNKDTGLIE